MEELQTERQRISDEMGTSPGVALKLLTEVRLESPAFTGISISVPACLEQNSTSSVVPGLRSNILAYLYSETLRDALNYATDAQHDPIATPESIELEELLRPITNALKTKSGTWSFIDTIEKPPSSREEIVGRQNAIRELSENHALNSALTEVLRTGALAEDVIVALNKDGASLNTLLYAEEVLKPFADAIKALPDTSDPLLAGLIEMLREIPKSKAFTLTVDSLVFQKNPSSSRFGLNSTKTVIDRSELNPSEQKKAISCTEYPKRLERLQKNILRIGVPASAAIGFGVGVGNGVLAGAATSILSLMLPVLSHVTAQDAFNVKKRDYDRALTVFSNQLIPNELTATLVTSLGQLDELMAFAKERMANEHLTCFPTISETEGEFRARGLINPILATKLAHVESNDVDLVPGTPLVLTGPNSGGKTSLAKAILQTQILAQLGGSVFAEEAHINPRGFISYIVPQMDRLTDEHGQFGSELAAVREILDRVRHNPNALIVFDELARGTTQQESSEIAEVLIEAFAAYGASLVLITHDLNLARRLKESGVSESFQVEIQDGIPTYRMIPGVATTALAQKTATAVGLDVEDLRAEIAQLKSNRARNPAAE